MRRRATSARPCSKECWKLYGWPFASGIFTVAFLTAALIIWSTARGSSHAHEPEGAHGRQMTADWTAGASGMAGSEAALTNYDKWPWEVGFVSH